MGKMKTLPALKETEDDGGKDCEKESRPARLPAMALGIF